MHSPQPKQSRWAHGWACCVELGPASRAWLESLLCPGRTLGTARHGEGGRRRGAEAEGARAVPALTGSAGETTLAVPQGWAHLQSAPALSPSRRSLARLVALGTGQPRSFGRTSSVFLTESRGARWHRVLSGWPPPSPSNDCNLEVRCLPSSQRGGQAAYGAPRLAAPRTPHSPGRRAGGHLRGLCSRSRTQLLFPDLSTQRSLDPSPDEGATGLYAGLGGGRSIPGSDADLLCTPDKWRHRSGTLSAVTVPGSSRFNPRTPHRRAGEQVGAAVVRSAPPLLGGRGSGSSSRITGRGSGQKPTRLVCRSRRTTGQARSSDGHSAAAAPVLGAARGGGSQRADPGACPCHLPARPARS